MPAATAAVHDIALESTEERFRDVFGAHRSTFSSRPESVRFPGREDYTGGWGGIWIRETTHKLFYKEVESGSAPFLWVTCGDDHEVLYWASRDIWREDPDGQLALIAKALCNLCDRHGVVPPVNEGPEWFASHARRANSHSGSEFEATEGVAYEELHFSTAPSGEGSVSVTSDSPHGTACWYAAEMSQDPSRSWEDIVHALTLGAPCALLLRDERCRGQCKGRGDL